VKRRRRWSGRKVEGEDMVDLVQCFLTFGQRGSYFVKYYQSALNPLKTRKRDKINWAK